MTYYFLSLGTVLLGEIRKRQVVPGMEPESLAEVAYRLSNEENQ